MDGVPEGHRANSFTAQSVLCGEGRRAPQVEVRQDERSFCCILPRLLEGRSNIEGRLDMTRNNAAQLRPKLVIKGKGK
jgi:hypothetical protein